MPNPDPYLDYLFGAFAVLRRSANEQGAISLSEINTYYDMFEDEMVDNKRDFVLLIHAMNEVMLQDYHDRLEKAQQ